MAKFAYVYVLQSEMDSGRFYTGLTDNLPMRLNAHNSGRVLHTNKWRPWRLKTYIAFSNRSHAAQFERYLKSASGRAFVKSICNRWTFGQAGRKTARRFLASQETALVRGLVGNAEVGWKRGARAHRAT
jgi:predicted GIY-YIG superfamily endonuclease